MNLQDKLSNWKNFHPLFLVLVITLSPESNESMSNLLLLVKHNSLWETLALFIKTNREEITRHSIEYYALCALYFSE